MPWSRFTCIRVNAEDWIEMKTTQHHGYVVFMPMMICLIFTFMADAFGYGKDIEKKSEEFYLLVGNVERCEYISWEDPSPVKGENVPRPDDGTGVIIRSITVHLPQKYMLLIFQECDIFKITDGVATNIQMKQKVALLRNDTRSLLSDEDRKRGREKILALSKEEKLMFFGELHEFPEGLIKDYGLSDHFVLSVRTREDFAVTESHSSMRFRDTLRKYRITLPEQKTEKAPSATE